jgi:transcriptional regulator with XRE-family HTH domain
MRSSVPSESSRRANDIGRRIRTIRQERGFTLRQVAGRARLSATHISEIERGHTTPTVGALVRIAGALGREPHFFLETEWLPEVSVVRNGGAAGVGGAGSRDGAEALTLGIPGGRLLASRTYLQPAPAAGEESERAGEETCGFVVRGRIEIRIAGETHSLGRGCAFHVGQNVPHVAWNPGDEVAEVIWLTSHPANSSR